MDGLSGSSPVTTQNRTLHPSEHAEQALVIEWWALVHKQYGLPEFALFAVPNGAKLPWARNRKGVRYSSEANKLVREGLRRGIPDLLLPVALGGFNGLAIEMKSATGVVRAPQSEVLEWFVEENWRCWVCKSADAAMRAVREYLAPRLGYIHLLRADAASATTVRAFTSSIVS